MLYTRDMIIRKLAHKSGYYMRDIRNLLLALDDLVEEVLGEATDDEDVVLQLVRGLKISNHIVPERQRVDPRDLSPIVVKPTARVSTKASATLKQNLQKIYDESKKDG